jgi:hypothetical protein
MVTVRKPVAFRRFPSYGAAGSNVSSKCLYFVYLKVRGEVAERLKAAVC